LPSAVTNSECRMYGSINTARVENYQRNFKKVCKFPELYWGYRWEICACDYSCRPWFLVL